MTSSPSPMAGPQPENDPQGWPLRAWGLTLLGAIAGLSIYWIARPDRYFPELDHRDLRMASATFMATAAALLGLLIERTRLRWSLSFALIGAALVGLTVYWNVPSQASDQPWRIGCAALAVAMATPLFQAWRGAQPEQGPLAWHLSYREVHPHAWTDAVLGVAAWAFVGVVWAMALLLGQLFKLIGIDGLEKLLDKEWMAFTLTGAALGAGIALLRDRSAMLTLLQRVVTTVLSVLAPVLALGLLIFLLAIPFTGLAPLWNATRSTSPILLGCIIGALCLTNAVIGEEEAGEARSPLLRAAAGVLSLAMLPLALIAAFSTGLRIQQHGITPDRLWAVIFTGMACAYGLAYLVSIARYRREAAPHLRQANLRLAFALTAASLLLATPLLNFAAISTRDQVARLEDGRLKPDDFDWGALRFDFGQSGMEAIRRLASQGATPAIRAAAAHALSPMSRYELTPHKEPPRPRMNPARLVVLPRGTQLPPALFDQLADYSACGPDAHCVVMHKPDSDDAVIVTALGSTLYHFDGKIWAVDRHALSHDKAEDERIARGIKTGKVEVRNVKRRQVYVDDVPLGDVF
ncbi:DUF4153 domain-containing protein [Novosphingobium terrae]|uniref:DUF4153 domain-containing protein n=1 Tax=Novosphingobium terrae TaxID=2726189 RepID=UPI001F13109E|nr:DUF4153 domain-containing protein [Novosphingobium terrae]